MLFREQAILYEEPPQLLKGPNTVMLSAAMAHKLSELPHL